MKSILPFTEEHEAFRQRFVEFLEKEAAPNISEWWNARQLPHAFYEKMGQEGFLCTWADPKYGGQGKDFLYQILMLQEVSKRGLPVNQWLHSDIVVPYVDSFGSEELKTKYLPKFITGELMACVAMTEPDAGSDLAAIKTSAVQQGDEFILNGDKCFITNGMVSDMCVVATKTEKGMTLFLVDMNSPGFTREPMRKIGAHLGDQVELHFRDVKVPVGNMLGVEGKGMRCLMAKLQRERMMAMQLAQGNAERVLEVSIEYAKTRTTMGKPLYDLQSMQFLLADMATEVDVGRSYADAVVLQMLRGEKDLTKEVSMGKLYCTEMAARVANHGLQIFGGHAFCYEESEMGKLFGDCRVQCISAGTSEIMKVLIARFL